VGAQTGVDRAPTNLVEQTLYGLMRVVCIGLVSTVVRAGLRAGHTVDFVDAHKLHALIDSE
jgi:hypothetical protein